MVYRLQGPILEPDSLGYFSRLSPFLLAKHLTSLSLHFSPVKWDDNSLCFIGSQRGSTQARHEKHLEQHSAHNKCWISCFVFILFVRFLL